LKIDIIFKKSLAKKSVKAEQEEEIGAHPKMTLKKIEVIELMREKISKPMKSLKKRKNLSNSL